MILIELKMPMKLDPQQRLSLVYAVAVLGAAAAVVAPIVVVCNSDRDCNTVVAFGPEVAIHHRQMPEMQLVLLDGVFHPWHCNSPPCDPINHNESIVDVERLSTPSPLVLHSILPRPGRHVGGGPSTAPTVTSWMSKI